VYLGKMFQVRYYNLCIHFVSLQLVSQCNFHRFAVMGTGMPALCLVLLNADVPAA